MAIATASTAIAIWCLDCGVGILPTYGKHHGCGGRVGDPHGEEHGGEHEAEHQSGLGAAHHHDYPQGHPVVQPAVLHCNGHDQAAQELEEGQHQKNDPEEKTDHVVGGVEIIDRHFSC